MNETASPGYPRRFLESMAQMWSESLFCDITVLIGKKKFQAHKTVLAAASSFFKAMFSSGMTEGKKNEIELHEISSDIFKKVITFIYTGSIHVDTDSCQDLLAIADMFGIEDIIEICSSFLLENISPLNCVGIYAFADAHNLVHLKRQSELYLEKNFIQASEGEEFLLTDLQTVTSLLGSEKIHIERESQVLNAAVNWVLADLPARRRQLLIVLNQIRINMVSHKHLFSIIDSCHDHGVKMVVTKYASNSENIKSLNPHGLYCQIKSVNVSNWPRQNAKKYIYVIGGFARSKHSFVSSINTLDSIERFDLYTKKWTSFKGMCHPRSSHGVAILDRKIVVAGGEDASLISDSVESFDPDENYWTPLPSMRNPRYGMGMVCLENCLYAIGGYVGSQIGATVEKYDKQNRVWRVVDKMLNPRFSMAAVEYEGLIYIVGGLSELYTESSAMDSYNPVTKEWMPLAKLRVPRAYHGLVAFDGYLYAVGGFNEYNGSLNTVEKYCIKENKWTFVASMDVSRAGAGVVALDNKIYVFGGRSQDIELSGSNGFSASVTLNSVECYDPLKDSWTPLPPMTHERCETMAMAL